MAQRLDRDREIYEPVFIGRVVSFIDVAEVGMECWRQFLGLLPFALNLIADPLRESWGRQQGMLPTEFESDGRSPDRNTHRFDSQRMECLD